MLRDRYYHMLYMLDLDVLVLRLTVATSRESSAKDSTALYMLVAAMNVRVVHMTDENRYW